MDYFIRNAGTSRASGIIATLCKCTLIWLAVGLVLLPGTVLEARAQAVDMMLNGYVGHKSSSGHEFDSRMRAFVGSSLMMMPRMGENAARDTQKGEADESKARRLFQQWVESRPHRKTLLNSSYKFVSTGVVQRGNKIWAVQIFFAPLPDDANDQGGSVY